jgi:hypothetical protein
MKVAMFGDRYTYQRPEELWIPIKKRRWKVPLLQQFLGAV